MQIISSQSHAADRQPDNYSIAPEIGGFPFIDIDVPEHDLWKSPGSLLPLDGFTIEHPTANHFGYCREVTNFPIPTDEWPPNLALDTACDRYRSSTPSLSNPIATLYAPAPQNNFVTPQETLEPERDEEFPFLVSPTSQKKQRLINGHKAVELVELLKSVSEERSAALLRRLREKGDLAVVLAEYRGSADEPNSSSRRSCLEDELMTYSPKAFPLLPSIDPSALARSHLLRPQPSNSSSAIHSGAKGTVTPPSALTPFPDPTEQSVEYCDERLQYLQVGFWTNMKVSSDFAARVISLYIRTDHPLLGLFNTSLFIADLVSQRTEYCSKFLFHALMSLGCMYSAFDESAMQHAHGFCQIAEILFETESDSYSSMAGAILLSISLLGHGKDHAVLRYATDAMKIGTRLGLFSDIQHAIGVYQSGIKTVDDDLSARSHAAWGVFNWNVMLSMFYRQPGSETPASAPIVPIPGETGNRPRHTGILDAEIDDRDEEDSDEEEKEDNPSEEITLRRAFPILCNFWRLVYKARWIYYSVQESPPVHLRNTLIEYTYRELIAWVETIPRSLIRKENSPHYVMVFHIWLHTVILDMWQPFVYKTEQEVPQLKTFMARDRTADAAYTASVNQLKHLIVEYRGRHVASTYSILWHNGLIYLSNAMLRCTDPEWRLYLLLCLYGYERLNRTYRISEVITQGLLTMTMRDTDMLGSEAYKIMEELKERGLAHVREDLEDKLRATFMVDLNLALTDPEAAKVENMANEFTDLATFQDLVDYGHMDTRR
ncbi:hypothetical protein NUW58_g3878 [Xylaria curta]|uniref:Uncharacterized protein n=1 Tax=Xylaria curta TaxID=42375 RepID=A0ACC1PBY0_9PEZI|nr:hypothetical protein NUW58_g3878 [Xylaria curta]